MLKNWKTKFNCLSTSRKEHDREKKKYLYTFSKYIRKKEGTVVLKLTDSGFSEPVSSLSPGITFLLRVSILLIIH